MNQTCIISDVAFEWDSEKALLVLKEHQVTFEECATVLLNHSTITKQDYRDYAQVIATKHAF